MLVVELAMALCLSVCVSQVGVLLKRLNESGKFWAWKLPLTYPTLSCNEIRVTPKIRARFSPETLFHTRERHATAYRSSKRVIDLARERWTLRA